VHPHGLDADRFRALFGDDREVVMAFHGYARAVHQLLHGRPDPARFHVHGYWEHGTTTTPFDMLVVNEMSRYDLCLSVLARSPRRPAGSEALERHCHVQLDRHRAYIREHLEDLPELREWVRPTPACAPGRVVRAGGP
jgi:xylulose-5-phosphate/fructose-6-phosphate phosphoketolase